MNRLSRMLAMLYRENFVAGDFERRPEPTPTMDLPDQVDAWHAQGASDGPIVPVYHVNALACSRLARKGSTVVDLGCGTGRYAAYLARMRPDLTVLGLDLSAAMVAAGNASLMQEGLADRVSLRAGDMTSFAAGLPAGTSLINCLFALHHLPGVEDVDRCLREIRAARERLGCGFWLFDLVRPRHASTAADYPLVFTPDAPEAFCSDSTYSLIAAYSHDEVQQSVHRIFGYSSVHARRSQVLPLYQAFWSTDAASAAPGLPEPKPTSEEAGGLVGRARGQYRALRAIMRGLPR